MTPSVREFVAVEVGGGDRQGTAAPSHLTLRFLGEVPPERNPSIVVRLREVADGTLPFALRLEGVGAFPSRERPRVVWVGVTAGREELVTLAGRVGAALEPLFGPAPEPFVPHLTLFRVRSAGDRRAADELLRGDRPAPPPREMRIDALLLKESVLGRTGAVHRTVEALPLGRGSSGQPAAPSPASRASFLQR